MDLSKWQERFSFFWYNDEELFAYTQDDFDAKAKKFSESGITCVITFSCTHFRFTMYPYWDLIRDCLAKLTKACHKYGIKVVEHHSSHLTFDPLNQEDWDYMERILNLRHSSIDSWEGLRSYIGTDPMMEGKPLSSFRQIDGRTGKWARTGYHGYCMCFNNPDYRKVYFHYLETLYAVGIDGIMTDDVQYFGDGNACTCEHCRRLFQEKTGYTLPAPEDWDAFCSDYSNPVYVAWKRFKLESTKDFQFAVNAHFKSLGYSMLRPNYVSAALLDNWTAYPFEAAREIWDFIFQENCFSELIHASYLWFAGEAAHRFAMAQRKGVPSMSMFYPNRADSIYLSWALSRSWGQMYLGTFEGMDFSREEAPYRNFEQKHPDAYSAPQKVCDLAFYHSMRTRDYTKDSNSYRKSFLSWLQAAYVSGLLVDMAFEYDDLDQLAKFPCIVLASVAMLSDKELERLGKYLENGGKILVSGELGKYREDGSLREEQEAYAYLERHTGNGSLIQLPDGPDVFQRAIASDRWVPNPKRVDAQPSVAELLRETSGVSLRQALGSQKLKLESRFPDLYASCFQSCNQSTYNIHIYNAEGFLKKEPHTVGHEDIFPCYDPQNHYTLDDEIRLTLRLDTKPGSVILYTPEREAALPLPYQMTDDVLSAVIPAGSFGGYALIEIK